MGDGARQESLLLPDQNLGRNTGVKVGIGLDAMAVWDRSNSN